MFRVGLTGGIGSGKSAVAELLRTRGACIVDTDLIAHQLTAAGGAAIKPIRARFGAAMLDAQGALDRARMRQLVFTDDAARRALEALLHPLIRAQAEAQARAGPGPYVVMVIPLLIESGGWAERADRILVVDLAAAAQRERVCRTRGLEPAEVQRIIDRQAPRTARLAAAHDVLCNDGTAAQLATRVDRLHAAYLRAAQARYAV
jgi:dephospho-CoA kinase